MVFVNQVLAGSIRPIGPNAAPTGIAKTPITGRNYVGFEGLACDQQGDRKNHGGREKALHHYAFEHYAVWLSEIGEREILRTPGAFGENLTTLGLTEKDVAVGDTFKVGDCIIQVSQGRQPCWKLNVRFDVSQMALRVQQTGLTGWYYRVLEPGYIAEGDQLELLDRVSPDWTIERLWRVLYIDTMNIEELSSICSLEHLPEKWRTYAQRRLSTRKVEDWSKRLNGDHSMAATAEDPPKVSTGEAR
ncbi:MOSC domain-containing protein [Brucella tritici]|uniref:MOSC domain-containing protein n=1 Tax=Brucella tritici TaxID=94626 RepID=A0A6L3YMZ1_9HYPH|nr:MOSC domain-containing protein [Brucella tritici]KAB2684377.1 MOSC domain-containing protein [Brucella tritici]